MRNRTQMTKYILFLTFSWGFFAATACIVTPAPDLRGWKCSSNKDCLGILDCYQGFCRGSCPNGDDLDCVSALKETCNSENYCVPPEPTCIVGKTQPCYTGSKGTPGKGICKKGVQTCQSDNKWGVCKGQVVAVSEKTNPCNGADDDCDGKVDNGLDCQCKPGDKRSCYGNGITIGCTNNNGKYTCNGICKAGIQVCGSHSQWGKCLNWTGPAKSESCNNADDDCDGRTDENYSEKGRTCTIKGKLGPCASGKITDCINGKPICTTSNTQSTEDCNGKDDDCDGKVDNLPGQTATLRRPCYTGGKGCISDGTGDYNCKTPCRSGFQICLLKQQTWSKTCEGQIIPAKESCNNKDDDCDGKVDNGGTTICPSGKSCTNGSCQ